MVVKSLQIKNKSYYFWNSVIDIKDFNPKLLKLDKKESMIDIDIYYIWYKIYNISPLFFKIKSVEGYIEKINDTEDRILIITAIDNNDYMDNLLASSIDSVNSRNIVIDSFNELKKVYDAIEEKIPGIRLANRNKIRFDSDILVFRGLTIVFRCVIMKDCSYYPEIYVDNSYVVI